MKVLFYSLAIVIIDQVSKLFVKGFSLPFPRISFDGMYSGQRIHVIGNFFRLTFIENPGMAFGFDPGSDLKLWVSLFSLFASVGLVIYLYLIRDKSLSLRIAVAFVLGGAVGNMIDRIFYGVFYGYAPLFYGRVVDFLDFDFFKFSLFGRSFDRWPIFNFADASVTIGVLILLFFYSKNKKETKQDNADGEILMQNSGSLSAGSREDSAGSMQIRDEEQKLKNESGNAEPGNGKEIPDKSS